MNKKTDFTSGPIAGPLMKFTIPIMGALVLQALYGAVDLLIVGQFASSAAVSAVATGSQILHTVTLSVTGLAMGLTIVVGQQIGEKKMCLVGESIGTGILLFLMVGAALTAVMLFIARGFVMLMQAPPEAFEETVAYVRICSGGILFITAYNLIGSIFRGIGDSRTPFVAVLIACVCNIALDLLLVAVFQMGAAGAALATVASQAISVALSLLFIRRRGLPFAFGRQSLRFQKRVAKRILFLGIPVALQDTLVSISFLAILAIVNQLGLIASAGVGVAEKLCGFIMLIPSAFMQSMSAYVAQNIGANQHRRAKVGLCCGIAISFCFALAIGYTSFFHGALLARIFSPDLAVITAAADYLRGFAIDVLLTSFLFCFTGYFNGCGKTAFVMAEGIIGSFGIRIPVSYFFSKAARLSLFHISLGTPASSAVQIALCIIYFAWLGRRTAKE